MATGVFFRARLDHVIDLRHPLAVLTARMLWVQIEASWRLRLCNVLVGTALTPMLIFRHHSGFGRDRCQQRWAAASADSPEGRDD